MKFHPDQVIRIQNSAFCRKTRIQSERTSVGRPGSSPKELLSEFRDPVRKNFCRKTGIQSERTSVGRPGSSPKEPATNSSICMFRGLLGPHSAPTPPGPWVSPRRTSTEAIYTPTVCMSSQYCSFVFRTPHLLIPEVRMLHMNSFCTSQRTHSVSITKTSGLMMFSESVDVEWCYWQ